MTKNEKAKTLQVELSRDEIELCLVPMVELLKAETPGENAPLTAAETVQRWKDTRKTYVAGTLRADRAIHGRKLGPDRRGTLEADRAENDRIAALVERLLPLLAAN